MYILNTGTYMVFTYKGCRKVTLLGREWRMVDEGYGTPMWAKIQEGEVRILVGVVSPVCSGMKMDKPYGDYYRPHTQTRYI